MKHQVKLSNGQILQIEEGDNALSIAAMHDGDVDAYICQINPDGVLTYPNSGPAGEYLSKGLSENDEIRNYGEIVVPILKFSGDKKDWHTDATMIVVRDQLLPGEDETCEISFKFTHEGLIIDVWQDNEERTNVGTSSETYTEIIDRLVEDNS